MRTNPPRATATSACKQGGRKKEHFQHEPQFSNALVVRELESELMGPVCKKKSEVHFRIRTRVSSVTGRLQPELRSTELDRRNCRMVYEGEPQLMGFENKHDPTRVRTRGLRVPWNSKKICEARTGIELGSYTRVAPSY